MQLEEEKYVNVFDNVFRAERKATLELYLEISFLDPVHS